MTAGAKWLSHAAAWTIVYGGAVVAEQALPNNLFTASGFTVRYADTAEKRAHLDRLPPDKLLKHQRGGKTYYLYADPKICRCVYVGTPEAYQAYRNGVNMSPIDLGGGQRRLGDSFNESENELLTQPGVPGFDDYVFGGMRDD
jgi:hypothetical protein